MNILSNRGEVYFILFFFIYISIKQKRKSNPRNKHNTSVNDANTNCVFLKTETHKYFVYFILYRISNYMHTYHLAWICGKIFSLVYLSCIRI